MPTTTRQRAAIAGALAIATAFVYLAVAWSSPAYLLCAATVLVATVLATWSARR